MILGRNGLGSPPDLFNNTHQLLRQRSVPTDPQVLFELWQRRRADDDSVTVLGLKLGMMEEPAHRDGVACQSGLLGFCVHAVCCLEDFVLEEVVAVEFADHGLRARLSQVPEVRGGGCWWSSCHKQQEEDEDEDEEDCGMGKSSSRRKYLAHLIIPTIPRRCGEILCDLSGEEASRGRTGMFFSSG